MPGLIRESAIPEEQSIAPERTGLTARRRGLWRWIRTHPVACAGLVLLAIFVLAAVLGPVLERHSPDTLYPLSILQAPGGAFPFGTDDLGRDLLSRILSGMRISLIVGVGSILVALVVGATFGLLGGYFGGIFDALLMRLMDIMIAFPALLLAVALMALLGGSLLNVGLAIAIIYVPVFARIMRSSVLAVRREQYIEAAQAVGSGHLRTMLRHALPNSAGPTITQTALAISDAILVEAALSYLGLGIAPPTPSLGALLTEGQGFMTTQPWMVLFPGGALMLGVLAFNLVGDSLRDLADPFSGER
ncbi:MAG TPA: ABC transporter permease [Chloroflexota bacterium]|nr:ABC transporter permease [Chloroflexota bacterium]